MTENLNGPIINVEAPRFGEQCQYGTKIIGNGDEVVMSLEFPDDTNYSVRLTPQTAHAFAARLMRAATRASMNSYDTKLGR